MPVLEREGDGQSMRWYWTTKASGGGSHLLRIVHHNYYTRSSSRSNSSRSSSSSRSISSRIFEIVPIARNVFFLDCSDC